MIKIDKLDFSVGDYSTRFLERVVKNQVFVSWGLDNMEVERWLDYVDFSPIHKACISTKVDNLNGNGFTNDYKINSKQSLNDISRQIFWEFLVTGNLFLEIVWRKDRTGIAGFHVIPSKYMRAHRPEDSELISNKWLYCHDWVNWKKAGIIEFHEFDPNDYVNRQIIHIRQYQSGYIFYGVPTYLSSMLDIRLSHAISEFNLAQIMNGASPSLWVHLPHEPDSQNEQENILRRIEERYRGSANAGRIIVSYGGEGEKPEITQIQPTMTQGGYAEIFALVRENILSGHQIVDPSLIGLPTGSGFSSQADQLKTSHELFMNTTIVPMQQFIIRELKPVLELMYPNEQITLEIQQNQILSQ
jgi:phage portal protein BeeE